MKKRFYISLIASTLLSLSNLKAQRREEIPVDTNLCLIVEGKIKNNKEAKGNCIVLLYHSNKIIDSLVVKPKQKTFELLLEKNKYYTIRLMKEGYIDRLVCIDTRLPKNSLADGELFEFLFTTELITKKESEVLNQDAIDFPIAIVNFDNDNNYFNHCHDYTINIKKQLITEIAIK